MSVTGATTRNDYTATADQTVFSYTFQILDASDLKVIRNGSTVGSANYTVTNVGVAGGGAVTLSFGAAAGDSISILLDMDISRTTQYQNAGDFLASDVNGDFDKAYIAMNQLETNINRAFLLREDEPTTPMLIPTKSSRASKYLGFDSLGNPTAFASDPDPTVMNATYNPNYTGAVGRTLKSRLEDYVSVKDWGAVCDGTTPDQAAIQSCFDNVPQGSTVFFPGTCAISSPITLTRKINVIGTGSSAPTLKKLPGFSGAYALKIGDGTQATGLAGVSLVDFFIQGNSQAGDGLTLEKLGSFNLMNFRSEANLGWGMHRDGLWLSTMINVVLLGNGSSGTSSGGVLDTFVYRETSDLTCVNFNSNKNINHQMLWEDAAATLHRMVAFYQLGGEYGTNTADTDKPVVEIRCADRCGFFGVRFNSRINSEVHDLQIGSSLTTGQNAFSDVKNLTFSSCHTQKNHDTSLTWYGAYFKNRITSVFFHNQDHRGNRRFINLTEVTTGTVHFQGCETIPQNDIDDPNGIIAGTYLVNTLIQTGNGTPEGSVVGSVGSVFLRLNGGSNTVLYIKESGTGNTGWVAK